MSRPAAGWQAAVLGSPISHSRSPQLHAAAYQHLGVSISYRRIEVDETTLDDFLTGEGAEPDWAGWSVTMPLKAAMVPQMTTVSPRVETLGVLNTVQVGAAGPAGRTLHGENTDVDGIVTALQEQGVSRSHTAAGTFAVLGAGGTAAAALAAAKELGFSQSVVYARSIQRAAAAAPLAEQLGLSLRIRPLGTFGEDIAQPDCGVVVSTLPPRAADSLVGDLPDRHPAAPVLLDVAYDPWPSALAAAWEQRGWAVTSGLEMLLHQAVKQVELFTQHTHSPAAAQSPSEHRKMVRAMRAALGLG
ncbi:shikimate dehydrogenase [Nesterenkonia ebinurensis]|uniref:shikimate dehydrogenase n=1 Tax=Nesterenkonia ebinurensis TaxID=2608252 RepID=UPI00123DC1C3|nr:shikimate dehydrogenase [Nesterenkonia ebinurensis]